VTPIFSDNEKRRIVRSFIEAYLRGTVKVQFPTHEELKSYPALCAKIESTAQLLGLDVDFAGPKIFHMNVTIASGAKQATSCEIEGSIDFLFQHIMASRVGGRIEGEFLEVTNVEGRLQSLEQKMSAIENLIEEIRNYVRVGRQ